jgi:hypothetical protein
MTPLKNGPADPAGNAGLLVGVQGLRQDELRASLSLSQGHDELDNQTAIRLKRKLALEAKRRIAEQIEKPNQ